MKLKLDDQGHAVLQDGLPVYVYDDGRESPFDAAGTVASLESRKAAAKMLEKRANDAETKLKAFEGIEDPDAARKALTTIANLDSKKLIDAGQVETVKAEINKAWEGKLSVAEQRAQAAEQKLNDELVGGAFARSKFIAEKMILPSDLAQAAFGNRFKVEDGKLKAYDADGNPVFSRKNPGSAADFDEAIEILVDVYPRKDSILKADNRSGSGPTPGGGGGNPGAKKSAVMTDAEKGSFIREHGLKAWSDKVTAEQSAAA